MTTTDFERARRPEHKELRRDAILSVAREMLAEVPLRDISLRELSRHVGLSKSNVVRYFPTREAIFFGLLNREFDLWLDDLSVELPTQDALPLEVIDCWVGSLARRPILCELLAALGGELERNIPSEEVRDFKLAIGVAQKRLARLVEPGLGLEPEAVEELVAFNIVVVAGLWPFANPSPAVVRALEDERLRRSRIDFRQRVTRALNLAHAGLVQESLRSQDGE
ncbi:TetR family transcriptional regulator [Rhodococcus koreensis]